MKSVKQRKQNMELLFILLLVIGAVGVQLGNGWLSKNEFNAANFAMMLPLFVIAQYFIAWGYHDGTAQSGFITTHIIWTCALVLATLAVNLILFHSAPTPLTIFALLLSSVAAVMAILGK